MSNRGHDGEEADLYGGEEPFGEFAWEEPDPEVTRKLLRGVSRALRENRKSIDPRRDPRPREMIEEARRAHEKDASRIVERLIELQVREVRTPIGVDLFTYRDVERNPDLDITPYLIDDVHYELYRRERDSTPSPYMTVSLEGMLSELTTMRETHVDPANFQRRQREQAFDYLLSMGIEEDSLHEIQTTPEGRYILRSLYRFLNERPLGTFIRNFIKSERSRLDDRPVDVLTFASRATKWFDRRYGENEKLRTPVVEDRKLLRSEFPDEDEQKHESTEDVMYQMQRKRLDEEDPDQTQWHELRMRELNRTRAFARPVAEYLEKRQETETA